MRLNAFIAASLTSLILTVTGCSQSEAEPVLPSQITPPGNFTLEQRTWEHCPQIQSADDELFARFLKVQPEWAGSPAMAGVPILYQCDKDRRFYWIEGRGNNATWTCLAWEQGKFRISEGKGLPFPESQPSAPGN